MNPWNRCKGKRGINSSLLGSAFYMDLGLIYRQCIPPNQDEDMVIEQQLPTQGRATILKLAHSYPWLDIWERPRLLAESCSGFTVPPCSKMWEPIVIAVKSARRQDMGESIRTLDSNANSAGTFTLHAMDIVGPLPRSHRGHHYILTVCHSDPEPRLLHSIDVEQVAAGCSYCFHKWESLKKTSRIKAPILWRCIICLGSSPLQRDRGKSVVK